MKLRFMEAKAMIEIKAKAAENEMNIHMSGTYSLH